VHWRDLPERFGPSKTVYERHRLWSANGTWERLLRQIQAEADAAGEIDWDVSADSTIVRAHQHAAGARKPGSYSSQEGRAGRSCLVGQVFGVGEAGAVVQGGVQVGVSGAAPAVLVGPAGRAAQDLVAAAVGDAAEVLDVDVDEFAGAGAFLAADRLPVVPVGGRQSGQVVPDENAVGGGRGDAGAGGQADGSDPVFVS